MKTRNQVFCALFAALIALGALVRIPFFPVPFTLQYLFANLAGLLLGGRYGALAVALYIGAGLLGLPIFTGGGGIGYLWQPTFGYLIGFMLGAAVGGFYANREKTPTFKRYFLAGLLHIALLFFCGTLYLYFWYAQQTPLGWRAILLNGCLPFLVPDILLAGLSAKIAVRARRYLSESS